MELLGVLAHEVGVVARLGRPSDRTGGGATVAVAEVLLRELDDALVAQVAGGGDTTIAGFT